MTVVLRQRFALVLLAVLATLVIPVGSPSTLEQVGNEAVLRPGMRFSPRGGTTACTIAFLHRGSDGNRYFVSGGHCFTGNLGSPEATNYHGEQLFAPRPPVFRWPGGSEQRIGEAVYMVDTFQPEFAHSRDDGPVKNADISLVRIDPGIAFSPQVCFWGGPTAGPEVTGDGPFPARYFGYGSGVGMTQAPPPLTAPNHPLVPARTAVVVSANDPDGVHASGLVGPSDSGGPLMTTDGRPLGVLNSSTLPHEDVATTRSIGSLWATRLTPFLERAEMLLGIEFELETAPLIEAELVAGRDCDISTWTPDQEGNDKPKKEKKEKKPKKDGS